MLSYKLILVGGVLLAMGEMTVSSLAAQSGFHSGTACPAVEGGIKISIGVDTGRITYKHRLNKRELAKRVRSSRGKTLSAYEQPLGLTVWSTEYALKYRPQVAQLGAREYCALMDSVRLDLIIKNMD
ncbi:MAG: hypothetical protein P8J29_06590, partial [Rhodospirillales bacterium]|nr:hypothetical protein [Rhodospirillales bacterium]